MTEAEKAALKWLNSLYASPSDSLSGEHLRTLKAMLAEPRLPAEPSEEMLDAMWRGYEKTPGSDYRRHHGSYSNLYAHLTAPKTKTVWRVSWDGGYTECTTGKIPDPPVPGAIEALLRFLDAGFEVAIFSSRSKNIFGRWAMKRWLGKQIAAHWQHGFSSPSFAEAECWGDAAGIWRRFKWPWFKPPALMTIDDRALTFNVDWSHADYTAASIRAFKPWNKK